jgi:predicted DCC family thiol-disulfide oxidoreductase YuxK
MLNPRVVRNRRKIILFDGICKLCCHWIRFVYQRDTRGQFKFVSVQSETSKTPLGWCDLPTHYYETIVYVEHRKAYFRSTAFLKIAWSLGFPWQLFAAGYVIPEPLRDWMYDRIVLNRYRLFGKHNRCLIPTEDLAKRFLP